MSTISERILRIIEEKDITRTEFANILNVTQPYVSKIINKGCIPSDRLIEDICEKFIVSESWLRTGEGDMYRKQLPTEEVAEYVEDLLDYDGSGNPFYDMIIEMMKAYKGMDEKSQFTIRNYFGTIKEGMEKKKEG